MFSTLVTVLGGVWVLHARAQNKSSHLLVAADLADQEMSRTLDQGFHDLTPSSAEYTQVWELDGRVIEQEFETQVEVFTMEVSGQPAGLKLVRVTVKYGGSENEDPKTFSVDGIVTNES